MNSTRIIFPEKRKRFFGSSIDLLTMDETEFAIEKIIEGRLPTQHVVVNVAKLITMRKDKEFRDIINSCPLISVDGQGIVWGARWLGLPVPERVTGIDLFIRLVELAEQKGHRVYFLGAAEHIIKKVIEKFKAGYPDLQIAGRRNGFFEEADEPGIVETIRQSKADILFVAMSSPKKEYFLKKYTEVMGVPFTMGVGGSFDVIAGMTLRAPAWMQRAGLEWFFRFLNEPRRLWKRYFNSNIVFLWMLVKAFVLGKKRYGCD